MNSFIYTYNIDEKQNKEKTMNKEELAKAIKSMDRNIVEDKFINLFFQYENLLSEKKELGEIIDFTDYKIKRRQQYLNKTYKKNTSALNNLLNELIETKNKHLQEYFNELYKELDALDNSNKKGNNDE